MKNTLLSFPNCFPLNSFQEKSALYEDCVVDTPRKSIISEWLIFKENSSVRAYFH